MAESGLFGRKRVNGLAYAKFDCEHDWKVIFVLWSRISEFLTKNNLDLILGFKTAETKIPGNVHIVDY